MDEQTNRYPDGSASPTEETVVVAKADPERTVVRRPAPRPQAAPDEQTRTAYAVDEATVVQTSYQTPPKQAMRKPAPKPRSVPLAPGTSGAASVGAGLSAAELVRVYGPRAAREAVQPPFDTIVQRIGPAPAAAAGPVAPAPRDGLPSLRRRDRRVRLFTVIGYCAVIAISIAGLAVVARFAFW